MENVPKKRRYKTYLDFGSCESLTDHELRVRFCLLDNWFCLIIIFCLQKLSRFINSGQEPSQASQSVVDPTEHRSDFLNNQSTEPDSNIDGYDFDENFLFESDISSSEDLEEDMDDVNSPAMEHDSENFVEIEENLTDFEENLIFGSENEADTSSEKLDDETLHDVKLKCSKRDIREMLLTFYLRHNLSWAALEDLLILINMILGEKFLPSSKYLFKKSFPVKQAPVSVFYCSECNRYLGTNSTPLQCAGCKSSISQNNCKFYYGIPMRDEIKRLIDKFDLINFVPTTREDVISDVHSANLYKGLQKAPDEVIISLTINTDGVNVFKSKKHGSLWPIQAVINEIDPLERFNFENSILCSLWFDRDPDMGLFLMYFVEQMKTLNTNPILIKNNEGVVKKVKVVPLLFTMDVIARCLLQKFTQFNGYSGCGFCLHPGKNFVKRILIEIFLN